VGEASQHFHLKPMCDHQQMPGNAARLAGKQLQRPALLGTEARRHSACLARLGWGRECCKATLRFRVFFSKSDEHSDPPYAVALLRPRHQRPSYRASEACNELPPVHSITSSVRPSNVVGKVAAPVAIRAHHRSTKMD
jgi:hypothetical protein